MLVYFKEPMSYLNIDGYKIYGKKYAYGSFGSTDIPIELYKKHEHVLIDAEYTARWLETRFGKKFPPISFTIKDLYSMEDSKLVDIAKLVGVKYHYRKSNELSIKERHALRKSIISYLNK